MSPTASYSGSAAQTPQILHSDAASLQQSTQGSFIDSNPSEMRTGDEVDNQEEESENDDLNSLDIPDLPKSTRLYGMHAFQSSLQSSILICTKVTP